MKKKIFTVIFFIISMLWIFEANAQQRYVRKKVKPEFFLPETAEDKPEKLPAFIEKPKPQTKKAAPTNVSNQEKKIPNFLVKNNDAGETIQQSQDIAQTYSYEYDLEEDIDTEVNSNATYNIDDEDEGEYVQFLDDTDLRNIPSYMKKYDDYLDDLQQISETGKAPYNKELEDDLAVMSSNEKIIVE